MPSALELASEVRAGNLSAVALVTRYLEAIAAREPDLHAFNLVMAEQALSRAEEIDAAIAQGRDPGALAGVPVAVKDNLCTRGIDTTASSKILAGWKPPYDATVVKKLRDSGAIAIGKTNLDEFAMGSSTENSAFGPTHNPWSLGRVPGGSSGGSAAAVAGGLAPLALGSDTGGSIRQPASFCGVVGIKPTYGLVSRYGLIAFASSLDQIGPFASSVADAVALLEAIAGHDPMDSTSLDSPVPDLGAFVGRDVAGLRVGVISEFLDGASAMVTGAVHDAAAALEAAGARVAPVSIPELLQGLAAYYLIAPAEASSNLARYDGVRYGLRLSGDNVEEMNARTRAGGFGDEVKRRIMLGTYVLSAGYYDAYYLKAQKVRTLVIESFARAYQDFDVLLSPTTPTDAFEIGAKVDDPLQMYLSDLYTIPSNLAGHPAMSVPFALSPDDLPLGVQVLAPLLAESVMVQVGAAIEASAPDSVRAPQEKVVA